MKAKQTPFIVWFQAQYGVRPNHPINDKHLSEAITIGQNAARQLRQCSEYDVRLDAAFKAWEACRCARGCK